jgi:hypothetical protein
MLVFFALIERKKDQREKGSTVLPKAKKRQLRKSYEQQKAEKYRYGQPYYP